MNTIGRLLVLCVITIISYPGLLLAASVIINEPRLPYEALAIDSDIATKRLYLGNLKGDPHTFELTISEAKSFTFSLRQDATNESPLPLAFIIVRSNGNNRGVSEIGRLAAGDIKWVELEDRSLGMKFFTSGEQSFALEPGVYRFEISSAINYGKYLLVIGTEVQSDGYFADLDIMRQVQDFFGVSSLNFYFSSKIIYPLGSLVLVILIFVTWRYHRRLSHA